MRKSRGFQKLNTGSCKRHDDIVRVVGRDSRGQIFADTLINRSEIPTYKKGWQEFLLLLPAFKRRGFSLSFEEITTQGGNR